MLVDQGYPVIPLLRNAATSDEPVAQTGMLLLVERTTVGPVPGLDLGAEGVAILRQLHEEDLVTQRDARRVLGRIAQ